MFVSEFKMSQKYTKIQIKRRKTCDPPFDSYSNTDHENIYGYWSNFENEPTMGRDVKYGS